MLVFLNGRFVPEEQAMVSIFDRGFLYGDGLFETMRVSRGRPFRWEEHFRRFEQGAAFLKIKLPYGTAELRETAAQLVTRNGLPECLLRLGISHGSFQKQEAQQIMEYLRLLKPEIFVEEPYDIFSRLAAWLRAFFTPPPRPQPQQQQPRQSR